MSRLKFRYFGSLMWKADSLEKTLLWEKIECKRKRGQERMRWLDIITDSMDMNLSKLQKIEKDSEVWHAAVHEVSLSDVTETEQQKSNKIRFPKKMQFQIYINIYMKVFG